MTATTSPGQAQKEEGTAATSMEVEDNNQISKDSETDAQESGTVGQAIPANPSSDPPNKDTSSASEDTRIPAPEIGPGWTTITKTRVAAGTSYKFYFTPQQKFRLRSKAAVDRFLVALKICKGDETMAFEASKAADTGDVSGNKANGKANGKASASATAKKAKSVVKQETPVKNQPMRNRQDEDPPPKKPPTTYLMYTSGMRGKIMEENPGASPIEISKILGGIWRALGAKEKDALKVKYLKDLEDYRKRMKEWQRRNPGKLAKTFGSPPQSSKRKRARAPPPKVVVASPPTKCRKKAKHSVQDQGTDWWEVEDFRDRRVHQGQEEYLIKWKGCPESSNTWEPSSNLNVQDDAQAWWKQETIRRNNLLAKQKRISESMKRLGLEGSRMADEFEDLPEEPIHKLPLVGTVCKRSTAPVAATKSTMALLEDESWKWDDASQVNFRVVQRISVHDPSAKETVTEARINGTPVVLTGHVGWANFALRWLRRKSEGEVPAQTEAKEAASTTETLSTQTGDNGSNDRGETGDEAKKCNGQDSHTSSDGGSVPMEVSKGETTTQGEEKCAQEESNDTNEISTGAALTPKVNGESSASTVGNDNGDKANKEIRNLQSHDLEEKKTMEETTESSEIEKKNSSDVHAVVMGSNKPLDLSDPDWHLDIEAMSKDIGDEEVPVVRKNYNESQPISGNILASKFFEAGWNVQKEEPTRKRRKSVLYLHQWQFPLSVEAGKKLCHQNKPLPNNILGEDLLKYWLDRVKLDSPLQYLFMGNADTMSKIHRDNGGLAISIAPITGEKECILVHRDDGHACLYHNQAPLDPDDIDLNSYPLLPHARIWKTTIKPGEILLMPHGTYHQCRNVTPCLSYSRFHLDGVNVRAFLHSMMDGDAPELHQDVVLWNAARELIDVVDKASDEKRPVDEALFKAVDALRALRNMAKEVTRKLSVRETVKGPNPSSLVVSSSVQIDGSSETWQSLVDDVDMCLHEFRYRFNRKIPAFKRRRSMGRKILALPALPFRGKSKPSEQEMNQGNNEPVVAFECPTERGFLALPKAPTEVSPAEQEKVVAALDSIVAGDEMVVRLEGKKCPARVAEIISNARVASVSFEDLPSLYNDLVPCDVLRTPSVGGSCLSEPPPEEIKPGKIFVCLMGKDEYRGVVQYVKCGRFFKSKLDLGNGYTFDKMIDAESILSLKRLEKVDENEHKETECREEKLQDTQKAMVTSESELNPNPNGEKENVKEGKFSENQEPKEGSSNEVPTDEMDTFLVNF